MRQIQGQISVADETSKNKSSSSSKEMSISDKDKSKNPMRDIEIEKIILNCGGTEDKLEKSVALLKMITGKTVLKTKARKRIPAFGISPGKEAGCKVTLRDKKQINELLKKILAAVSNKISDKKINDNHFSLGINEYIEVPELEYKREIGILGFEVSVVFKRKGRRISLRKIKRGKYPKKQYVTKQEIIDFLNKNFGVEVI